jgi:SAM-dependent methyltransferase
VSGVNEPVRVELTEAQTSRASRTYWDQVADEYLAEHGEFLGEDRFIWSPEGVDEADAQLLGPVRGRRILEVGCGAAQCARWLATQGADVVAFDISVEQLRIARTLDERTGTAVRTSPRTRSRSRTATRRSTRSARRSGRSRSWPMSVPRSARSRAYCGQVVSWCSR